MMEFISANLATIITVAGIIAIVGLVVFKMISDKRKGKSTCACGCANCPSSEICHPN